MAISTKVRPRRGTVIKYVLAVAVVVLVASVGAAFWVKKNQKEEAERLQTAAAVPQSNANFGVGALGRLEAGWKIYQIAPANVSEGARVENLLVEEGDFVQSGTTLAILNNHDIRKAALAESKAQVEVLQAKLAQVKAGIKPEEIAAQEAMIAKQKASLDSARTSFSRAEGLARRDAISREDYDRTKTDFETTRALLDQAEKTLAAMKVVRPEEVAVAEAELAKAKAGVSRAEADLQTAKIVAPIAGRVLKIHARTGEKIGEMGLAEIGDTSAMHAVAEVYERDAPRVKIGQKSRVKVQSIPGELSGEVIHVGWKVGRRVVLDNDPVKDTDARVVEVRVKLDSASSAKVAGLSNARVEVHINAPAPDAPVAGGK